jgi:hypothetical protein
VGPITYEGGAQLRRYSVLRFGISGHVEKHAGKGDRGPFPLNGRILMDPNAHVFISHATEDQAEAVQLVSELEAVGIRCWLGSRDIPAGANYADAIVQGIKTCSALVVLLSRASVSSPHVRREVNMAVSSETSVFPFSLDPAIRGAGDLPGDWNYWLSLVQIYPFSDHQRVVSIVAGKVALDCAQLHQPTSIGPADSAPGSQMAAVRITDRLQARRVPDCRTPPSLDDKIRSALIQAAASGMPFSVAVDRARHHGASQRDVEDVAYRLRDSQLLDFDGELALSTPIKLT